MKLKKKSRAEVKSEQKKVKLKKKCKAEVKSEESEVKEETIAQEVKSTKPKKRTVKE